METTQFLNLDCVRLKNDSLELLVTQSVGPRIIRLSLTDGDNLLAELPDSTLECPGSGQLKLWGGHRLWHAPEVKHRTYLPDDHPVDITDIPNGVEVVQPTEAKTGIQKSMRITLPDDSATVVVDHTLKNEGVWPVELAPWAITQLKPGGTAILPQITGNVDPDGVLPNRRLTFWPYTDVKSPHLQWGNKYLFVEANMQEGKLKMGFPNPIGWIGYHLGQTLFVKKAAYQPTADYVDFGSSSECFCCPQFIELETLGPNIRLAPGQIIIHTETWHIYGDIQFEASEAAAENLAKELSL